MSLSLRKHKRRACAGMARRSIAFRPDYSVLRWANLFLEFPRVLVCCDFGIPQPAREGVKGWLRSCDSRTS